jgi:hypothetical protein
VPDNIEYVYGGYPPVTLENKLKLTAFPIITLTLVVDPATATNGTAGSIVTFPVTATVPDMFTAMIFSYYAVKV